jgi:hypothetical protein
MAGVGALWPVFAPYVQADRDDEPGNRLPQYEDHIVLAEFVSGNTTINFAEGQLYGDNALQIDIKDFVSATFALETTYINKEAEAVLYGTKIDPITNELINAGDDVPPWGGFGFVRTVRHKNRTEHVGYYFPKVQANLGNESAQTKNSGINFGTPTTNLTIFKPKYGGWRYKKDFNTEEEALEWVAEKLGIPTI